MAADILKDCRQLSTYISLTPEEQAWFARKEGAAPSPPCGVSSYYLSLIDNPDDPDDPIRRQCIPTVKECEVKSWDLEDPLGEDDVGAAPRLLHRYHDRALFLSTDRCWMYCRHCFRRRFTAQGNASAGIDEMYQAAEYLKEHTEIRELLISGGDPLTMSVDRLEEMLQIFRGVRPSLVLRICTRAPVVYPQGITERLIGMLSRNKPLYVVTQYNHPRECTGESLSASTACINRGMPVLNQTVLLRGINDHEDILEELFTTLTASGIVPYYLFQGDLAQGTSHFRVPLKRSIALAWNLTRRLSGISMPILAVDLPGGGGKVRLLEQQPEVKCADAWGYRSREGALYWYPLESS